MSSAAPPDAISASSPGTGNKKKNKKRNKPKKNIDTGDNHVEADGAADHQSSPSPRDDKINDLSAGDDEPDTPVVSDLQPQITLSQRPR